MSKNCQWCGAENETDESSCGSCGKQFVMPASNGSGCWVALGVVAVLAVIVLAVGSKLGSDSDSSSSGSDVQQYIAFDMCKQFVEDRLQAPGTATFRNPYQDDGEVNITGYGDGPYTIVSTVDAENSVGASLRIAFTCTVTNDYGDHWVLDDLVLTE